MSEVNITEPVEPVLRSIIEDGAEMRAVLNVMRVWAAKRGFYFGKGEDAWQIARIDGLPYRSEEYSVTCRSIHELLDFIFKADANDYS